MNKVFVALDVESEHQAAQFARDLGDEPADLKVGLELFTAVGPSIVTRIGEAMNGWGARKLFLDLKLHDIPETVRRAAHAASHVGARFLTVHSAGGAEMMRAAVQGAGERAAVLAVTVLTSLTDADLAADGYAGALDELATRRARLAIEAGCAGVVCSPREASAIRAAIGPKALIVTPGVRPAGAALGDQKRVDTPAAALAAGASAVVVGRPIRDAADRRAALRAILAELG